MPELPEVEVLVRHLDPLLRGKTVRKVRVFRRRVIRPTKESQLRRALQGSTFQSTRRRGKYLIFELAGKDRTRVSLVGHLGMTGRMYLSPARVPLPRHAALVLEFSGKNFVFEDTRYFGRITLETEALERLGPEPLGADFTTRRFAQSLASSRQPIKVKLLDQSVVAGVGNIYASEALFRARISPTLPARNLSLAQISRLRAAIRRVLTEAIRFGSTLRLDYSGNGRADGLFYFGRSPDLPNNYEERLRVYDRAHAPCPICGRQIKRIVQAARSTFFCPRCQAPS
jgi:formamidopyrimidine-DNA glycosylase